MKKIIIIGSGIGGLTAGNLLAKKGHDVTIFESHSMPGGYTAGFMRKGFYFESGTLSFEASASVNKAMKDIGISDKVTFVPQRLRFVSDNIDGSPENYNDFKNMFYSGFSNEKDKLDKFFAELDKMAVILSSFDKPMPFLFNGLPYLFSVLPFIFKGPKMVKTMGSYEGLTTSEFLLKFFEKDSKLYNWFKGFGYPDMAAYNLAGAATSMFSDYWTVKDGMQSWADALAANFRKSGGKLLLNSYVEKIITKDSLATGVLCNNRKYQSDYVIAACDYKNAILKLLDNKDIIPLEMRERIKNSPVSEGFFTVYLGLKMPADELKKYMQLPHVMFFDEKEGLDIYNSEDEEYFDKNSVSLYSPSMINPKHAPVGKTSLMLQTTVPYRWMENWGAGDKQRYKVLKEKAMDSMIKKASKLIPDLQEHIEFKEAATPLTYERYTHNSDGASSSWSWNPRKKFFDNAMSVNVNTPVKNLYIGSCWSMQIGGIPGALAGAYQSAKNIK